VEVRDFGQKYSSVLCTHGTAFRCCGVAVTVGFLWEAVTDVTNVTSVTAYFFISVPDYTKAARAMATEQ
jgi:hypothetical protein